MVIDVPLAVQTRVDEVRTTLLVAGELDARSAPFLRDEVARLLETNPSALRLDLTTVGFVDSTGLGALVGARKAAAAADVPFELIPSPAVRQLLRRTALLGWFFLT